MIHLVYVVRSTSDFDLPPTWYETRRKAAQIADELRALDVQDVVVETRHAHAWDDFGVPAVGR